MVMLEQLLLPPDDSLVTLVLIPIMVSVSCPVIREEDNSLLPSAKVPLWLCGGSPEDYCANLIQ